MAVVKTFCFSVGGHPVCRFRRNWLVWVGLLIKCQAGWDVRYLWWRSSNLGLCSFRCCSEIISLL